MKPPHTITIKWHINQFLLAKEVILNNTSIIKIISIINTISNRKDKKWDRLINNFDMINLIINKANIVNFLYVILNKIIKVK